ncbi:alpha/beta hydrolase [Lentisphaera marina]|uniref:alpha/beta hydrolase n=1 Tax=Lentisphaera marina TaxID=1111041 RepID=UPI0023660FE8|nr:alpha/beta hydrolase [Lentisphaera marina]MDD7983545.1 alpha/beta hydrolase [Lentisphaera marina]
MRIFRLIFICSTLVSAMVLQANQSSEQTAINLKADIVYKTIADNKLHLDLFYPASELSGPYPLVIYTHGGGWAAGSKNKAQGRSNIARTVRGLTDAGFCVAAVQYRLCKDGKTSIRDCVTDSIDALRYLAKESKALHLDPNRVFTYGDSAGGQLAQMLLLSQASDFPGAAELAGQHYTMLGGVSWYGPCDFEKTQLFNHDDRPKFRDRFGPRVLKSETKPKDKLRLYREVSPVNYLQKTSPPLLMIQGDGDTTIPVKHAYYMKEKADLIEAPVEIMIIKNAGHNWRKADGSSPIEPSHDAIIKRTIDFLVSELNRSRD